MLLSTNLVKVKSTHWDTGRCYRSQYARRCPRTAGHHAEGRGWHRDVSSVWFRLHRKHCRLPSSPRTRTSHPLEESEDLIFETGFKSTGEQTCGYGLSLQFLSSHQDKVSPCTLVSVCLCPHTAAHRRQEEGCCTVWSGTACPYHRSHCTGSKEAKSPSYLPLQEYIHI